jgi:hypothetical protein
MANPGLGALAGGLDGLMMAIEAADQRKRQKKQDDINDQLMKMQLEDRERGISRQADEDAWTRHERGEVDPVEHAGALAPFLKPELMGDGPMRGPTARGPGGTVGVPRRPEPEADPLMSAITKAARPGGISKVGEHYYDPNQSAGARGRLQTLQDRATERAAANEDFALHAAITAANRAPTKPTAPPASHFITDKDGNVIGVPSGTVGPTGVKARVPASSQPRTPAPRQPTEFQKRAASMYEMGTAASAELERLADSGKKVPNWLEQQSARVGLGAGNYLTSDEFKQMRSAALLVADAWLRLQTGAAAPEDEVERNAQALMPQPGDGEGVLAQKKRLRGVALSALRNAAGNALPSSEAALKDSITARHKY